MANLNWCIQRQYFPLKQLFFDATLGNRLVDNFSCSREDEYLIQGEMGMPLPPFIARFSPDLLDGHMMGVADEDGHVMLIDTAKQKSQSLVKEWSAHSNAVFDLAWINKEAKLVTASGDQTARLWDVQKAETLAIFRGHTCSLKSVAVQPSSSRVFITGARDGNILLWDARCSSRNGFSSPDSKQSVTSVLFQDGYSVISSGACDGTLKYWDIRKNKVTNKSDPVAFHVVPFPGKGPRKYGYSSLVLNSSFSRLFAVCTNDIIYEYSTSNLSNAPVATYYGHNASSFYVKAALSPDDRFLLCGSGDNHGYIWRVDQQNSPPWLLKGHFGEVTSVAWAPGAGEKIVTCSDDNSFKVWRLFQELDENSKSGKCERKLQEKTPDLLLRSAVNQSDEMLEPKFRAKCLCKPLDLSNQRKIKSRWQVQPVLLTKDCQSPVCQTPDAADGTSSCETTPKPTMNSKLLTPIPGNDMLSPSRPARNSVTPRSSRLFMESWLKSPVTPKGKTTPNLRTIKEDTTNTDESTVVGSNCSEAKELGSSKPIKIEIKSLSTSKIYSKQTTNNDLSNVNVAKGKVRSARKVKQNANGRSENIRTFLLCAKRKRGAESNEDAPNTRAKKVSYENKFASEKLSKDKLDEHSSARKQILTENTKLPRKIKDLFDHAEDSTVQ